MKQFKKNKDELAKEYIRKEEVFADLINLSGIEKNRIVKAEELEELNSEIQNKRRDLLKRWKMGKGEETILGIEIQSAVDPSMPVRVMEYDALVYKQLLKRKRKEKEGDLMKGGEFLSGIRKGERISRVLTLVLNLSGERWDGARSIQELVEPEEGVSEYRMKLIEPSEIEEERLKRCRSGVGELLRIVKAEQTGQKVEECMRKEEYGKVDKETAEMINAYTGYKFRIKEEGGQVNMSRAFDELEKKWEKQGKEEEKINTAKRMMNGGLSDELIAQYADLSIGVIQQMRKQLLSAENIK